MYFLIDVLMMVLLMAGRHHDPAVDSGPDTESVDRSTDTAVDAPERQPAGSEAVRFPRRTVSTSTHHSSRGQVRPGGLTGSEIPVWTALDDHQFTRLLKQSSP